MERYEVPNLFRRDLLMLTYVGEDKVDEALAIVKPHLKPNLSREEERNLVKLIKNLQSQMKGKRTRGGARLGVTRFLEKEAAWLSGPVRLPINYKIDKLPPPPRPPDDEGDLVDSLSFREPSNYCFMCSSTSELGDCPLPLTRRLSKSLVAALQLQSSEEMDYEGNLLGCVVCPPCYEKVIEVNDAVKELELIQWNLKRMAGQLDELLSDGIQNQKNVQVEIHGVPPTYLTPVELRKEIVDSRKKQLGAIRGAKAGTKVTIPFNTTTRPSTVTTNQNQLGLNSFSPVITSVRTLAPASRDPGLESTMQEFRCEQQDSGVMKIILAPTNSANQRKVVGVLGQRRKGVTTLRAVPFEDPQFPVPVTPSKGGSVPLFDHDYSRIDVPNDQELGSLDAEPDLEDHSDLLVTPHFLNPQSPNRNGGGSRPLMTQFDLLKKSKQSGVKFQLNLQKKKKVDPLRRLAGLRCPVADCGFRCAEGDRLQGHVNGVHHKEPKPFKCNYSGCNKEYSAYNSLTTHHIFSHGFLGVKRDRPFKCDQCSRSYLKSSHLSSHKEEVHPSVELTFPCPTCGKVVKTKLKLRNHMRTHRPPEFKCPSTNGCPQAFHSLHKLKTHQGKSHPMEFPDCVTRGEQDGMEGRKARREEEAVDLICEECGWMSNSAQAMKRHVRVKHASGEENKQIPKKIQIHKRKCLVPDCGFKATDVGEMKKHRLSHGTITPTIPCSEPNCSRMFVNIQQRNAHVKRKHDEKNRQEFKCGRCGREGFASEAGLNRHDELCAKGGRKDFSCGSCSMKFSALRNLTRHKLLHPNCKPKEAGANSVYCGTCGELCSSNNSLARHTQLIHNQGNKPFQCTSCPMSFGIKMYLTRHLKESKYCPGSRGYIRPPDQGQNSAILATPAEYILPHPLQEQEVDQN